jgi:hypothetical protein
VTPFAEELNRVEGSYRAGGGNEFSHLQQLAARLPERDIGDRNWNTWKRKADDATRICRTRLCNLKCRDLTTGPVSKPRPPHAVAFNELAAAQRDPFDERPKFWPGKVSRRSKEDRHKSGEGTVGGGVCMTTFSATFCTSRLTASTARFLVKSADT